MQPSAPESDESNQMKEAENIPLPDGGDSDREKSAKKKLGKSTDPNVKALIDYFCSQYQASFSHKYTVSGERDGQVFKDCLKDHSVEILQRCIDLFLVDTDPWLNSKRTVPVLRSRINQYIQTVSIAEAPVPPAYRKLQ
jgi:hypothetical protein